MANDISHQHYLELSARIAAVEYLVKRAFWNVAVFQADAESGEERVAIESVNKFRQDSNEALRHASFPSLSPASSDHVAAMSAEHVGRVLGELIEEMEAAYGLGKGDSDV